MLFVEGFDQMNRQSCRFIRRRAMFARHSSSRHRWPKLCAELALARGDARHPRLLNPLVAPIS
jgi:hypothetical protein